MEMNGAGGQVSCLLAGSRNRSLGGTHAQRLPVSFGEGAEGVNASRSFLVIAAVRGCRVLRVDSGLAGGGVGREQRVADAGLL